MVGIKYISYLTPTMSDNIILQSLCFAWHSGIILSCRIDQISSVVPFFDIFFLLNTSEDNILLAPSFRDVNIISSSGRKNSAKCTKMCLTVVD